MQRMPGPERATPAIATDEHHRAIHLTQGNTSLPSLDTRAAGARARLVEVREQRARVVLVLELELQAGVGVPEPGAVLVFFTSQTQS